MGGAARVTMKLVQGEGKKSTYLNDRLVPKQNFFTGGEWERPAEKLRLRNGQCEAEAQVREHARPIKNDIQTVSTLGECCELCSTTSGCRAWLVEGIRCDLFESTNGTWSFCD